MADKTSQYNNIVHPSLPANPWAVDAPYPKSRWREQQVFHTTVNSSTRVLHRCLLQSREKSVLKSREGAVCFLRSEVSEIIVLMIVGLYGRDAIDSSSAASSSSGVTQK